MSKRSYSPSIFGATGTFAEPGFSFDEPYDAPDELAPAREFSEYTDDAEARAANDDYYVTSAPPSDSPDSVTAGLIRGLLWWAFFVSIGFAAFAIVLR